MSLGGNPGGLPHHGQFRGAFAQAHIVQHMLQRNEFHRGAHPGAGLGAHLIEPVHNPAVERGVIAHRVIDPLAVFQQFRQALVDLADGLGVIGTVALHCALGTGTATVPGFHGGIALPAEQTEFLLMPRRQHGDGFGFRETGQIIEIAILAIGIMDVAIARRFRGSGDQGDGARTHTPHQHLAAPGEFV